MEQYQQYRDTSQTIEIGYAIASLVDGKSRCCISRELMPGGYSRDRFKHDKLLLIENEHKLPVIALATARL